MVQRGVPPLARCRARRWRRVKGRTLFHDPCGGGLLGRWVLPDPAVENAAKTGGNAAAMGNAPSLSSTDESSTRPAAPPIGARLSLTEVDPGGPSPPTALRPPAPLRWNGESGLTAGVLHQIHREIGLGHCAPEIGEQVPGPPPPLALPPAGRWHTAPREGATAASSPGPLAVSSNCDDSGNPSSVRRQ